MQKKVAVLAVNPVNGFGLFQYLEAFFENRIPYKTFAVADNKEIKANSGITLILDDVIANLKGHEDEYDALVFACGDAIPTFVENAGKQYNQDMLAVMAAFAAKGKLMVGHCGVAVMWDAIGIANGKKVAVHPYAKQVIKKATATDEEYEIDANFYSAKTENTIATMLPEILKVLA